MIEKSWKERMNQFVNCMKDRIKTNMKEKNLSWRDMQYFDLIEKLKNNIEDNDWISVSNYAFMLWENNEIEKDIQASQRYE